MDPHVTYFPSVQQAAIRPTRPLSLAAGEVLELSRVRHLTSVLFDFVLVAVGMALIAGVFIIGFAVAS